MKREIWSGFTIAISFTMVSEWMQMLLLILGVISALIPVIKTIIDACKGNATMTELQNKLKNAENEISYLNEIYRPEATSQND